MGYRSDLAFSTSVEGFNYFNEAFVRKNELLQVKYPLNDFEVSISSKGVVFSFSGLKWYDAYPEIQAFEKAWEDLDAKGFPWTRVRIGEDFDDIECSQSDNAWESDIPRVMPDTSWTVW